MRAKIMVIFMAGLLWLGSGLLAGCTQSEAQSEPESDKGTEAIGKMGVQFKEGVLTVNHAPTKSKALPKPTHPVATVGSPKTKREYARCLDQIAILVDDSYGGDAVKALAPYRCMAFEPESPERWNPRCVADEAEWYVKRYGKKGQLPYEDEMPYWYGLVVCTPAYHR